MYFYKHKQLLAILMLLVLVSPGIAFATLIDGTVTDPGNTAVGGVGAGFQGSETGFSAKDTAIKALEQVGAAIAGQLLNKLTESTVNWINSGFEENPQYVENSTSFFKNLADVEVKGVIDQIGYDAKNFPFGKGVAVSLIKEYVNGKGDLKDKATFTLDKVIGPNYKDFSTDFSQGGWPGLQSLVENPNNTPIGAYIFAKKELHKKIDKVTTQVDKELTRGQGFLDQKVCVKRKPGKNVGKAEQDAANQSAANQALANQAAQGGTSNTSQSAQGGTSNPRASQGGTSGTNQAAQGGTSNPRATASGSSGNPSFWSSITDVDEKDCDQYKSMSPGSVVEASLNKAIGSKTDNQALASVIGSISSSLGAIANALTNQLVSRGLGALSSKGRQAPAAAEQEWSYNGYTLTPKPKNSSGGFDYSQRRVVDLEEILITGAPDQTQVITNPTTGEVEVKVLTRKKTVLENQKTEKENYRKISELIDGNKDKGILSLSEKLQKLDACIPGPDYGWELRLRDRFARAKRFLQQKTTSKSEKKAQKAEAALEKLEDAAEKIEKDIRLNALENNIPSFSGLTDEVLKTRRYSIKAKDYYTKYLESASTVSVLESMKTEYLRIKNNPNSTDTQLGDLLQRYAGMESNISNDFTLSESKKDYNTILQQYNEIDDKIATCNQEKRTARTFSLDNGASANAYDSTSIAENEQGTTASELTDIPLIDIENNPSVPSRFRTEFGTSTPTTYPVLSGLTSDEVTLIYSVMKAYPSNTRLQDILGAGLTGDALFTAAKNYADDVDDDGLLPMKVTNELKFYCWDQLVKTNTKNYWRTKDVNIKCNQFYQSDVRDYQIDKDYSY